MTAEEAGAELQRRSTAGQAAEAADAEEAALRRQRGDEMPDGWPTAEAARRSARPGALEAEPGRSEAERRRGRGRGAPLPREARRTADARAADRSPTARRTYSPTRRAAPEDQGRLHPGLQRQAALDGAHQIIGADADQSPAIRRTALLPTGSGPSGDQSRRVSADAGYCSDANLRMIERRRIEGYIATGRQKHGTKSATANKASRPGSLIAWISTSLSAPATEVATACAADREPVFGQIKQARGFRQFPPRGTEKVSTEWALICTAHNLVKLARAA